MININSIIKAKRLSKIEVAKRMGLSRESLYRILSGNPTLDNITKLAAALGVPVTELFEQPKSDAITCPNCGVRLEIKAKE